MRLSALLATLALPAVALSAPPDWRPGQGEWRDHGSARAGWRTIASDGNELTLIFPPGGPMAMAFDFKAGAGYCIAQRDFTTAGELPENYEFSFDIRAAPGTPVNTLEFKLLDESGDNVWWVVKRSFEFPPQPQRLVYKKRHFQFAWGPGGAAKPLTRLSKLEVVVSSTTGGKGTVYVDNLAFRPLPAIAPYTGRATATAVSAAVGATDPARALDGDPQTAWTSGQVVDPSLTVDYGQVRELGGLALRFGFEHKGALVPLGVSPGDALIVECSTDSETWTKVYQSDQGVQGLLHVPFPPAEVRCVRISQKLNPQVSITHALSLAEIIALPPEFGEDRNAYWRTVAADYPRGALPRYWYGEQSCWTVVGVPSGRHEALINEEGMVEVDRAGFSLEPSLVLEDGPPREVTWAASACTQSLDAPGCPRVTRTADGLQLDIVPVAAGPAGASTLIVQYSLTNTGQNPLRGRLILSARPFQVNPPWQFLNTPGGVAAIGAVRADGDDLLIDAKRIAVDTSPTWVRVWPVAVAASEERGAPTPVVPGSICGAFSFEFDLPRGAARSWHAVVPFESSARPETADLTRWCTDLSDAARKDWTDRLGSVTFTVPAASQPIIDSVRANLAYILINRDGPGFQPGSRSYERSWIRDGSLTSAALLEFGFTREVKEFIAWYASHQFPSGKVPCVVDSRGPDPVPEHDSHGQLIYVIAEYYRYTGDKAFVQAQFPGATLLYRRSSTQPGYTPNSAGLTDVAMGALGLAEVLAPGAVERVLTGRYPACNCRADIGVQGGAAGRDGARDNNDFVVFINAFFGHDFILADVGVQGGTPDRDGRLDNNDFVVFINEFFQGC